MAGEEADTSPDQADDAQLIVSQEPSPSPPPPTAQLSATELRSAGPATPAAGTTGHHARRSVRDRAPNPHGCSRASGGFVLCVNLRRCLFVFVVSGMSMEAGGGRGRRCFCCRSTAAGGRSLTPTAVLLGTGLLQGTNLVVLSSWAPAEVNIVGSLGVVAVSALLQIVQVVLVILAAYLIASRAWVVRLSGAWQLYLATVFAFAGFYTLCYVAVPDTFSHSPLIPRYDNYVNRHDRMAKEVVMFVYFSMATQSVTGFGDIHPNSIIIMVLSNLQMLLGILYNISITAFTLKLLRQDAHRLVHGLFHNLAAYTPTWAKRVRRKLRRYMFVITVLIQIGNVAILYYFSGEFALHSNGKTVGSGASGDASSGNTHWSIVLSLGFQLVSLFIIVAVSAKYVRKLHDVDLWFIASSYLSTVSAFAGVYVLCFLWDLDAVAFAFPDKFWEAHNIDDTDEVQVATFFWPLTYELLYFSVVTMTTAGFGDVFPRVYYARILVSFVSGT